MKINTKIRYGLRMLVILAKDSTVINTEHLGDIMIVSPKYLRKLAGPLERADLIKSVQGKYGGYKLNKDPENILISDIFDAFDESQKISGCTKESGCVLASDCITSNLWKYFEELISKEFFKISLKSIVDGDFK